MKKQLFSTVLVLLVMSFSMKAQDIMVIKMNDNTISRIFVKDIQKVTFESDGEDPNYPVAEAIDLGLPSGTKWASWNVGASNPEEYGSYYAWGETDEKSYYAWSTYTNCSGSAATCKYIGDNIAGTQYDVAQKKWRGSWHMPSLDQIKELCNNCKFTWRKQNGVNGTLVTGPNGATIFLPAAGIWRNGNIDGKDEYGYYWSSSLHMTTGFLAYRFYFDSNYSSWDSNDRYCGLSIRAVCP